MSDERLLGKLDEFRSYTSARLDRIEAKVDDLSAFYFKVSGATALICFILTLTAQFIK